MKISKNYLVSGWFVLTSLLGTASAAQADLWKKCANKPTACPYFFDAYPRDKAFRIAFNEALQRANIRKPAWLTNTTATPAELLRGVTANRFLLYLCEPHNCGGHFFWVIYEPQTFSLRGIQVLDDKQSVFGDLTDEEKNLLQSRSQ